MILKLIFSFIASCGTSVLYNIEKRLIIYCGVSGTVTWLTYYIFNTMFKFTAPVASLIALLCLTFFTRFLSKLAKVPSMMFNVSGIMPIVPGGLLFNTFNSLSEKHYEKALDYGFQAVLVGGAIAIGFILNEVVSKAIRVAIHEIKEKTPL